MYNMSMKKEKKIRKDFTISPKVYEQALEQASKLGLTLSAYITFLILKDKGNKQG